MKRKWVRSDSYRVAINIIVQERKAAGVSQRELAERLGKPPSFINKIELLERRLDILEFVLIAKALGGRPSDLFAKVADAVSDAGS